MAASTGNNAASRKDGERQLWADIDDTARSSSKWTRGDAQYPPRPVSGFLKKAELELLHQRRGNVKRLGDVEIDEDIAGRFYQQRAIRRVGEAFDKHAQRKALLVMATGSGKTRTVIAL